MAPLSSDRASPGALPPPVHGTPLPEPVLAAAKLLIVYVWLAGNVPFTPDVHLPFVPALDAFRGLGAAAPVFTALFALASLALLANRAVRLSSFTCGALVALSVLAARPVYSNSRVFFALLLLLASLQDRGASRWMFRGQLFLVYFGAGLDKLLDPDWRSGRFFEHWTANVLPLDAYRSLAALLPDGALSLGASWLTLGAELGLALAFLAPRLTRPAVAAGLGFHVAMLVVTEGRLSWVFLYAMGCAYLCLARWPAPRADRAEAGTPTPGARLRAWAASPGGCFALAGLYFVVRAQFLPLRGPLGGLF